MLYLRLNSSSMTPLYFYEFLIFKTVFKWNSFKVFKTCLACVLCILMYFFSPNYGFAERLQESLVTKTCPHFHQWSLSFFPFWAVLLPLSLPIFDPHYKLRPCPIHWPEKLAIAASSVASLSNLSVGLKHRW